MKQKNFEGFQQELKTVLRYWGVTFEAAESGLEVYAKEAEWSDIDKFIMGLECPEEEEMDFRPGFWEKDKD